MVGGLEEGYIWGRHEGFDAGMVLGGEQGYDNGVLFGRDQGYDEGLVVGGEIGQRWWEALGRMAGIKEGRARERAERAGRR